MCIMCVFFFYHRSIRKQTLPLYVLKYTIQVYILNVFSFLNRSISFIYLCTAHVTSVHNISFIQIFKLSKLFMHLFNLFANFMFFYRHKIYSLFTFKLMFLFSMCILTTNSAITFSAYYKWVHYNIADLSFPNRNWMSKFYYFIYLNRIFIKYIKNNIFMSPSTCTYTLLPRFMKKMKYTKLEV